MGSPLSPTFANIFMSSLETQFLENCTAEPNFYRRYIDNIIAGFPSKLHAQQFLDYINVAHPNIKLTIETETNSCIYFLDIAITKSSFNFFTNVFRKA